ncbi:MAG TPA: polyprenyl synthetase family protein [Ardenticatenaceae bacterium]|nr:polyprenyl synthetase family protein [Ardenticatenaceae bacterium]
MDDIETILAPYVEAAERELRRRLPPPQGAYRDLYGMLHYHLGWVSADFEPLEAPRGKRLRPALCLLACEAFAGDFTAALPAAAAVELLHQFSLVHDDIQDGDRERHARTVVWANWGKPHAINAGDGLFALAQLALLGLSDQGIAAPDVVEALLRFNETAVRLCQGQYLDMSFERRPSVSEDEYVAMVGGKTAALLGCAAELGALSAGASEKDRSALHAFGESLGVAFQMQDDLLGLWGDPGRTGKPVGNDIRQRKKSLPIAVGLQSTGVAGERLRELYARPKLSEQDVAEVLALLQETGARERVRALAHHEYHCALDALDGSSLPAERRARLHALSASLLERDR